jgi:hypothetical protein
VAAVQLIKHGELINVTKPRFDQIGDFQRKENASHQHTEQTLKQT